MGKKKIVNRVLNYFGLQLGRIPSQIFKNSNLNISKSDYSIVSDEIYFNKLTLQIPIASAKPILNGYFHAIRIVENLNGVFSFNNEDIIVTIGEVKFFINDHEELFIINEVFTEGCYNIISDKKNVVVVDIGMNVGITSLFFSLKDNVKRIYSYELFPPTFNAAQKNISINPTGIKIIPHCYGLGESNKKLQLPYSSIEKGRMGIMGLPINDKFDKYVLLEVEIRNVGQEIGHVVSENKDCFFICKMDCEGAEYEIMANLYKNGLTEQINVFMIEWHFRKPTSIIKELIEKNFTIFYSTFPSDDSGLIYALKSESKN